MSALLLVALSIAVGLFLFDRVMLQQFRNSLVDLTIPIQVHETLRTPEKLRALRRAELLKKGTAVQISFAGRLRTGVVRRAHTKRAEIMIPNRHGKLFPVRRRINTLTLMLAA